MMAFQFDGPPDPISDRAQQEARREARINAVREVLRTAAMRHVPEAPGIVLDLAEPVSDFIDALRADDTALIAEQRDTIAQLRAKHADEMRNASAEHHRLILAATARERSVLKALDHLHAEGTPSEKAAITRLDRRLTEVAKEVEVEG